MVDAVLEAVSEGKCRRFNINLFQVPDTIDAALLSRAVTRVHDCQVYGGLAAQKQAILAAVVESQDLALNTLRMGHGNIGLISADIMAAAAVKLNTFGVRGPTTTQLGEIMTRLATTEDTKLRRLELGHCARKRLTYLPPETLATALMKLEMKFVPNIFHY